jgi:hypothetical protein
MKEIAFMIGAIVVGFMTFTMMGLPLFIYALLYERTPAGVALRVPNIFSWSSIPAMLEARTVDEFVQNLVDEPKRGAYAGIMSNMRKLLLDIKRHRIAYPADIDELKTFVLSQLRYYIERSAVRESVETGKFRELAQQAVLTDIMQDIYMNDCKLARAEAMRRAV